ncbi:recombinase family protein [Paramicrobacterium chengjingii]|uniref:Recombinase family protein n=1 Tax=Paramicrobacterium chengjingii TaxID=2769067 RepID=A0ABX6YMX8_9MICO|nr:recombinase family protein [Microbacterium chengjingii]QPZ39736.1 recombinase family protein [Microbacterium chengjingii]
MRPAIDIRPATPRAVLYLRQSTYREESISLELQEAAGRAHAEKNGYRVVDVLADPGISGRTWKRPAVQRVMEMIEHGDADVIVLWRWSRLSRNRKDWALAADRADLAGGRIESATEPNDATAAGRFARGVMTELAAFESERIGEQWKEAHDRRRRLGLPAEGGPRFGYIKQDDGKYVPDNDQSIVLAEMYRRYNAGEGFTRIARSLNERGILTNAGNVWSRISVTQILDAGFGAGKIVHRPGRRKMKPSESIYLDGAHQPVISADDWRAYLARREDAPAPRVVEPKYILAGLIFCGDCGAPMHVGNRGLVDYKCSAKASGKTNTGLAIKRLRAEQFVTEWLFDLAGQVDELAAAETKAANRRVRAVNSREAITARIAKLDQRMARLTAKWLDGELPESAYKATIVQLDTERASLDARQKIDERQANREIDVRRLIVETVKVWADMTVLEKRSALQGCIARIDIMPPTRPGAGVWRERVKITTAWDT